MRGYFRAFVAVTYEGCDFIFGMGVGENMERIAAYVVGRAGTGEEGQSGVMAVLMEFRMSGKGITSLPEWRKTPRAAMNPLFTHLNSLPCDSIKL